jgi:hypothetical protein
LGAPRTVRRLRGSGSSGSSGYDTGALAKEITTRVDQHPGFAVRSVSCPKQARKAKGGRRRRRLPHELS